MNKRLLFLLPLAFLSCKEEPAPPPPAPMTDKEIASTYWKELIRYNIAQPDSFNVISETIDTITLPYSDYKINFEDSLTTFYHIEADFTFKGSNGGWERVHENYDVIPHQLIAIGSTNIYLLARYGQYTRAKLFYVKDSKPLQKVDDQAAKRAAIYQAYQDSLQSLQPN